MDLNEFLKLRYGYLRARYNESNNVSTQIKINAKLHELQIIAEFIKNKNTDHIFEL